MTDRVQSKQPPEILFIERCIRLLKPGSGRCAIVLPDGILGSPGLGYVREWILQHTRVLASIDLHPDTFQPHVSVQTSVLVLERKDDAQMALESAAGRLSDYKLFMGNSEPHRARQARKSHLRRDEKGNEIVEEREEAIKEYVDGHPIYKQQRIRRKVVDDNTLQVAQEFRAWLFEQG